MCKKLCIFVAAFGLMNAGCEKTTVEGPAGKKLTVVKPMDSTIQRGDTEKVSIIVTRDNFSGPVSVKFSELPKGVTVETADGQIEGNERTFVLSASGTADLVKNHAARVTVSGPDGMSATEIFNITIKDKA